MTMTVAEYNAAQAQDADTRHGPVIAQYRQGQTLREIAASTQISFQRVGQIIQRAKRRGLL